MPIRLSWRLPLDVKQHDPVSNWILVQVVRNLMTGGETQHFDEPGCVTNDNYVRIVASDTGGLRENE